MREEQENENVELKSEKKGKKIKKILILTVQQSKEDENNVNEI